MDELCHRVISASLSAVLLDHGPCGGLAEGACLSAL